MLARNSALKPSFRGRFPLFLVTLKGVSLLAREFARPFYSSRAWKETREAYINAHPLCERCLTFGRMTPGTIVHHIEHLSPENIDNPAISLGFDNLETVCRDCHAKEHPEIYGLDDLEPCRVGFDVYGNVIRKEV